RQRGDFLPDQLVRLGQREVHARSLLGGLARWYPITSTRHAVDVSAALGAWWTFLLHSERGGRFCCTRSVVDVSAALGAWWTFLRHSRCSHYAAVVSIPFPYTSASPAARLTLQLPRRTSVGILPSWIRPRRSRITSAPSTISAAPTSR